MPLLRVSKDVKKDHDSKYSVARVHEARSAGKIAVASSNPALALPGIRSTNDTLFCATYCTDLTGTFEKSGPSPSAIVGWTRMASRSLPYGRFASIAVSSNDPEIV